MCCHNEHGRDLFCAEYTKQTARVRMRFRAILNGLQDQPTIEGWRRENGFDRLAGKKYARFRQLGKLIVKTSDGAHRPLGYFGPYPKMFTLLAWATERDWEFSPPNVLEAALTRMHIIEANPSLADVCDL